MRPAPENVLDRIGVPGYPCGLAWTPRDQRAAVPVPEPVVADLDHGVQEGHPTGFGDRARRNDVQAPASIGPEYDPGESADHSPVNRAVTIDGDRCCRRRWVVSRLFENVPNARRRRWQSAARRLITAGRQAIRASRWERVESERLVGANLKVRRAGFNQPRSRVVDPVGLGLRHHSAHHPERQPNQRTPWCPAQPRDATPGRNNQMGAGEFAAVARRESKWDWVGASTQSMVAETGALAILRLGDGSG